MECACNYVFISWIIQFTYYSAYISFHHVVYNDKGSGLPWRRHQTETFPALLALCAGNSPVNSPHKGHWRGALMFYLICAWIIGWECNHQAGDLRRHRAHHDVTLMCKCNYVFISWIIQFGIPLLMHLSSPCRLQWQGQWSPMKYSVVA